MREILLDKKSIHKGNLILVNHEYAYREEKTDSLMPVQNKSPEILLKNRAVRLLCALMEEIQGFERIVPVSGWRSKKEQQEIWANSIAENGMEFTEKYVAFPGHSEHQTGLAIDLGLKKEVIDFICPDFPDTGICGTFRKRASEYGFIERYPLGKEAVTGIAYEPWHFRYVGIPHAAIISEKKLTLEEYISFIRRFPYGQMYYCCRRGNREMLVSYLKAEEEGNTLLKINDDLPYSVSGNNIDGFIITKWREENE